MITLKAKRLIIFMCLVIGSISPSLAQKNVFNFGFGISAISSQMDGDNMSGYNKPGFGLMLNGGFNINENSEVVVATSFQKLGSSRDTEPIPVSTSKYLLEVDLKQIGLELGYAVAFGANDNDFNQFRTIISIKANALSDVEGNLFPRTGQAIADLTKPDFKSYYLSSKVGAGINIGAHLILDLNFEIGLQSIIEPNVEFDIKRLLPYHFGLGLTYYL